MTRFLSCLLPVSFGFIALTPTGAQSPGELDRELHRIFASTEYSAKTFGPAHWSPDGRSYSLLEPNAATGRPALAAYDAAGGGREILVDAAALTPAGAAAPLEIEAYSLSADRRRVLIFTNARRVWRERTRGDYSATAFIEPSGN
jgi:dipeptidyl-peptidase 4